MQVVLRGSPNYSELEHKRIVDMIVVSTMVK